MQSNIKLHSQFYPITDIVSGHLNLIILTSHLLKRHINQEKQYDNRIFMHYVYTTPQKSKMTYTQKRARAHPA